MTEDHEETRKEGKMNEKRFFYSDPLAAAWMAKHFGLEIEGLESSGNDHWLEMYFPTKLFIHADSLHLLEPIPTAETQDGYIHHDLCHVRHAGRDYSGAYHECLGFCGDSENIRVIQRNGIAFHWPETEAAESSGQ